jgi:hypothetical protein
MTEYQWKTVSVIGFDELMNALDRADRKGYMPDAIREEWEGFNWEAQLEQAPVAVVSGYYSGQCVILPTDPARIFNSNTPLYTTPPQRTWVGLTNEQREKHRDDWHSNIHDKEFKAIEAKLKQNNGFSEENT